MFPQVSHNQAENGGGGNRTRVRFRPDSLSNKELWLALPLAARIEVAREQLANTESPFHIPGDSRLTQVYAVQEAGDGPIKIGHANSVKARMCGMQSGNPRRLYLLAHATLPRRIEKLLHYELAEHRIGSSEWFEYHRDVLEAVDVLKAYAEAETAVLEVVSPHAQ